MSSTSWVVLKRKRETISCAPPSRKRSRNSDTPASTTRQQTLTQAHWVTGAPTKLVDDADLIPITTMPRRNYKRTISKRNSTLTQMDFFNCGQAREEEMNDALLPIAEHELEQLPPMPQLDGIYGTPRKPRKRKSSLTEMQEPSRKRPRQSQGSRDYRPSSRKSHISDTKEDARSRRTSERIAQRDTILSDPAENLEYFEKALAQSSSKIGSLHRRLEIQDSTATGDDIDVSPAQSQHLQRSCYPVTPQKQRPIVLSSQSPVSLSPNKRFIRLSAEVELRSPLRERSVNVPTAPQPTPLTDDETCSKPTSTRSINSNTLRKRPQKRKARVEDSQANLWSLPETSSPEKKRASQPNAAVDNAAAALPELDCLGGHPDDLAGLEIPSTSQILRPVANRSIGEEQDTPHGLRELTSLPEEVLGPVNHDKVSGDAASERLIHRDFADVSSAEARACQQRVPEHNEILDRKPMGDADEIGDSESEFGSPIANDTQFNFDLEHRTSSPSRTLSQQQESNKNSTNRLAASQSLKGHSTDILQALPTADFALSPQPTPRLVQRSSPEVNTTSLRQEESGSDESLLPQLPKYGVSITQTSITRVPLNDVQPSSSPVLPLTRSTTQRSIHPASMPRPSQISTQEATQAYLGQSSMTGPDQETEILNRAEKITIKDSSSVRVPLSQIPRHTVLQSQPQLDLEGYDLNNDDADYDLDPPSSDPPPQVSKSTWRQLKSPTKETPASPPRSLPMPLAPSPKARQNRNSCPSPSNGQTTYLSNPAQPPSSPYSPSQSTQASQPPAPPLYSPLKGQYTPIPGFNNETQSNFTQNGHVTAAYIHRQREKGQLPKWFIPKPYQVPGYTKR